MAGGIPFTKYQIAKVGTEIEEDLLDKYPYKTTLYFDGEMGSFGKKQSLSFQEAISIIRSEKLNDEKRKRNRIYYI